MGYYDRVRKKQQIEQIAMKAMQDPRMKEYKRTVEDEAYNRALDAFLLISVDYMFRNFRCKKDGIIKYVSFFVDQMNYAKKDPNFFELLNEELKRDTGVDVLGNRLEKSKKYAEKEENHGV